MRPQLVQALSPIVRWSKIFGIPVEFVNNNRNAGYVQCKWSTMFSFLVYLFNIGGNIAFLAFIHEFPVQRSSTRSWNFIINRLNYSFATIGIHTALLMRTCICWPALRRLLQSFQSNSVKLNKKDYRQLKYASIACSSFIILVLVTL